MNCFLNESYPPAMPILYSVFLEDFLFLCDLTAICFESFNVDFNLFNEDLEKMYIIYNSVYCTCKPFILSENSW